MGLDLSPEIVRQAILDLLIFIISFAVHEWGHAKMADLLGDHTPRSEGRVTLNPIAHIDPVGTILMPLLSSFGMFGSIGLIGWAKPVYTNPANFRNRNTDQALVTIAGPAMNFALALVAVLGAAGLYHLVPTIVPLLLRVVSINVMLIVFNLLPIPPLDGSKFLMYWFGMSEETYMRISQWGGFFLLLLVNVEKFQILIITLENYGNRFFTALFYLIAR